MSADLISYLDVCDILRAEIAKAGGLRVFAEAHGLKTSTVANFSCTARKPTLTILEPLDLEEVTVTMYRRRKRPALGEAA